MDCRMLNHFLQMIDMAVDISIRKKTYEMKSAVMALAEFYNGAPSFALKESSGFERFIDQTGSLCINSPRSYGIVPHFRISHILIGRESYRRSVSSEKCMRAILPQKIEMRRVTIFEGVTIPIFSIAYPIHDNHD